MHGGRGVCGRECVGNVISAAVPVRANQRAGVGRDRCVRACMLLPMPIPAAVLPGQGAPAQSRRAVGADAPFSDVGCSKGGLLECLC